MGKRIIQGVICLIVFLSVWAFTGPKLTGLQPSSSKHSAIIRVLNLLTNSYCTAVVVTNEYAVTAGHCVILSNLTLNFAPFEVFNSKGSNTGITVDAFRASYTMDLGILSGDFSTFEKAEIDPDHDEFQETMGSKHIMCGYGLGAIHPFCHKFIPNEYSIFTVKGEGRLVPGMSGGPVFNLSNGHVVAINSAAGDGYVVVIPLQGVFSMFGLQVD